MSFQRPALVIFHLLGGSVFKDLGRCCLEVWEGVSGYKEDFQMNMSVGVGEGREVV